MAKFHITFNGVNASGHVTYGNLRFPCGQRILVDGDKVKDFDLTRLFKHQEFTVVAVPAKDPKAEKVEVKAPEPAPAE